ncbi:MAG TPA: class I SAM-dependent methyltransferase [bacterium]|nr:class I SAM-dependent methyltransferase [bacterium]HPN45912.1 class I SAM-dependent methyltransferase [bacterium]
MKKRYMYRNFMILTVFALAAIAVAAEKTITGTDAQVKAFLDAHKNQWHDMNIPEQDGQILYDLIITNNYTRALEIGTSTGHSGIWIAWALSKTGGKLITIDIDRERHEQAVQNFKEAGLDQYIDARLGDAHEIVPKLGGPFDFVFNDADKDWYVNYTKAILPKLVAGGCYTAHNVNPRSHSTDIMEYWKFVSTHPQLETKMANTEGSSIAISYKRATPQTEKNTAEQK